MPVELNLQNHYVAQNQPVTPVSQDKSTTGNTVYAPMISPPLNSSNFSAMGTSSQFNVIDNEAYQEASNGTPYNPESYSPSGTYGSIWENTGILGQVDYPNVTYQEYNAVDLITPWTNNYVDSSGWWIQQRPRGSSDVVPIHLFRLSGQNYVELPYNENIYNWGNANSGLSAASIPSGVEYHTGFKVGHYDGNGGYPELANFKGCGYFRLTDYPPAAYSGTFRPFAHKIFNFGGNESFPTYPRAYSKVIDSNQANTVFKMESDDFTGALNADLNFYPPQNGVIMNVNASFYPRRNISVSQESVAIVAQSTMYWRPEAHDCDTVMIKKTDGTWITHQISIPSNTGDTQVTNLGPVATGDKIYICQQDRYPAHYTFVPETAYQFRSSYSVEITNTNRSDLTLKVYEQNTDSEINDNIVVAVELANNLSKAEKIHIEYNAEAEFSPGVIIKAPNTSQGGVNWQDATHYKIEWEAVEPTSGVSITGIKIQCGDGKDPNWTTIVGNTSNNGAYVWDTSAVPPGNYYIKVTGINSSGIEGWDISNARLNIPDRSFEPLKPHNYPNPFRSDTRIKYQLENNCDVTINIYNIAGELVRTLAPGAKSAGIHEELWDGNNNSGRSVASGVYLIVLKAGSKTFPIAKAAKIN